MVLMGIVGELGAGKTLTLTFLGWKNWIIRKQKVFSNYHLYKIPYYYISAVNQLEFPRNGVVLMDEIWRISDSRLSLKERNKFVADILGRSRKRHLHYLFTAQLIDQIDKRIRKVMDFSVYPLLNRNQTLCKITFFRTGFPKEGNYMKTGYYKTVVVFNLYDTDEEIDMEEEGDTEIKPIFQESPNSDVLVFDSWEEADAYARKFWKPKEIAMIL